jgi:hypothetical protein
MDQAPVDSRYYIVAFELHAPADCPPDFPAPPGGFEAGLFLPRDDPDWFGRSAYPPRLLLLDRRMLRIVPHPSTAEPASEYPLERIASVKSGHMLLKGWLEFSGGGFHCTLRYNTRGWPAVSRFMSRFREFFLDATGAFPAPDLPPGAGLDIKFGFALSRELDPGEPVAGQFFQPPRQLVSRRWWFPRRRWTAGDLLVITDRRLLWITDREGKSYSRYGSVASYAPLRAVRKLELSSAGGAHFLVADLHGAAGWRIKVPA